MYQSISCVNDRVTGGIKITVTPVTGVDDVSEVDGFQLRRLCAGSTDYNVLTSGDITEVSDLTYTYNDADAVAGVTYVYEACIHINGVWNADDEEEITCQFEGIVLSDETGLWHTAFGPSESRFAINAKKNRPVNYIVTLSGKFPHRVSNTQANYWTGTCSGIWLPWKTANGCTEPTFENADAYRLAFMEWLMTDTQKYMKTSDGKAMLISIDGTPQEVYNPIAGMTGVTFDWTQTGEVVA